MNEKKNWITISAVPKTHLLVYWIWERGNEFSLWEREKNISSALQKWKYPHFFRCSKWAICHEQKVGEKKKFGIDWKCMQNWLIFLSFYRLRLVVVVTMNMFRFDLMWSDVVWFLFDLRHSIICSKWNRSIGLDIFMELVWTLPKNAAHNLGFDRLVMSTKYEHICANGIFHPELLHSVIYRPMKKWYSSLIDNLFELSLNWAALAVIEKATHLIEGHIIKNKKLLSSEATLASFH